MASPVKVINCLLCELVSQSAHNKHTLVNVYSGNIIVSEITATLQFGLYVELSVDPTYEHELTVDIRWLKKPVAKAIASLQGRTKDRLGVIAIPSFPLVAEREGMLEIFLSGEGLPRRKLISKRIFKGDLP